jgi:DNA polymerase-3 subunit gamma/tau
MAGNKKIIQEFTELSKTMKFPEVMLFEGDSGTGKTTAAYIIAALLVDSKPLENSDGSRDPNPESDGSKTILRESFNGNVRFYNAADMNKQAVLDLEDEVSTQPLMSHGSNRTKVLIIDEAQELGKAAKGAVLKLLEKKRRNVYIILCTMDVGSFEKAVRSRCVTYSFRPPFPHEIAEYLFNVLDNDGKLEEADTIPDVFLREGLMTISESCGGSVREAAQILTRCVNGKIWTQAEILAEFSIVSNTELTGIVKDLLDKNPKAIVAFQSVKDFGPIFYRAWKVLTDAYLFRVTGHVKEEWKRAQAEQVSKHPNLRDLVKTFDSIEQVSRGYISEMMFLPRLVDYYESVSVPSGITHAVARVAEQPTIVQTSASAVPPRTRTRA